MKELERQFGRRCPLAVHTDLTVVDERLQTLAGLPVGLLGEGAQALAAFFHLLPVGGIAEARPLQRPVQALSVSRLEGVAHPQQPADLLHAAQR